jgi:hypothetical protein
MKARKHQPLIWMGPVVAVLAATVLLPSACVPPSSDVVVNPFVDFPPVAIDGEPQAMPANIVPLGQLEAGRVLSIKVEGEGLEAALVLLADPQSDSAGIIVGGGPADETFLYRVAEAGRYFVYARFDPLTDESDQRATLTVGFDNSGYQPPAAQIVRITFEENYLTDPGLADPESFTDEEIQLLADLEQIVRQEVVTTLKEIFTGTPVAIVGPDESLPAGPISRLTFKPDRVVPEGLETFDAAIPAVDPGSPCAEVVLFGEVLPNQSGTDHGNFRPDDEAVVYVGSFQGRSLACRTAVVESLNNIVLALSHTAAHEIGHLVGLYHVALVDIMDRRPTSAFQRRLGFERGQVLVEFPVRKSDGLIDVQTRVLTTIIQDPERYFELNFAN